MILVTGSAGYIGSQLCHMLYKNKINFIGIDNLKYANKKNIIIPRLFYKTDISGEKIIQLINKKKINTVIHCAAYSYVVDGEKNKKKYIENNIIKTKKFIDICQKNLIKNFIFLSSSNVYKDGKSIFHENNKKEPKNLYGRNKLEIENYLKKKFENLIILRLFNVVGLLKKFHIFEFEQNKYQRLFFKMVDKENTPILRYFNIKKKKVFPKRDFVNIDDVIDLILKILKKIKKKKINEIFNVGSGKATPINEILKIFKKYNKNLKILDPKIITKKELVSTKANINKIKKFVNWKPKRKIKQSILTTIKYGSF